MAKKPPPLPSEILSRVLTVATIDGRLLMIAAGSLALLHAMANDLRGAIIGVLVAGAGALELHGAGLVREGYARGMDWLVRSQLLLLAIMLIYAAIQLTSFDPAIVERMPFTSEQLQVLEQLNVTKETFMRYVNAIVYSTVGIVTLIYQGLMAAYYHSRRSTVATALDEENGEEFNFRD